MSYYADYVGRGLGFDAAANEKERKVQLRRIVELRNRDVIVFAAAVMKGRLPVGISYQDVLPFSDQIANLANTGRTGVDVIVETHGGSGETVEDIVKILRNRYESVAVVVPGVAKSSGTILAMAADEILMEPAVSSLGPIDAQIIWQGKQFSAHALLDGLSKIKEEVIRENGLNRAYVPILQNLSPGELQHAQNALDFARGLVREWLCTFKFKDWTVHASSGAPVTPDERRERADEIARELHDHGRWKTHGRSIKLDDLLKLKLRITNYAEDPALCEAIRRYHSLVHLTFEGQAYKLYETVESQIVKLESVQTPQMQLPAQNLDNAYVNVKCPKCDTVAKVQARLKVGVAVDKSSAQFPKNDMLKCPGKGCAVVHNLAEARKQLEAQTRRKII